jgi:uncharacterized repeat protein (TIGR01451 family)
MNPSIAPSVETQCAGQRLRQSRSRLIVIAVFLLLTPLAWAPGTRAQAQDSQAQNKEVRSKNDSGQQSSRKRSSLGSGEEIPIPADKIEAARAPKTIEVLIELVDEPAVKVYAREMARTDVQGEARKTAAATATKNQMAFLKSKQEAFAAIVTGPEFSAKEIYRVQRVLNGIAVHIDPAKVEALRKLPGVKAVHEITPEFPTTAISMPFLGVPNLWGNTLGLPSNITGTGVKLGIIDTGLDYQHPNFGGTGLLADYQANPRTSISPPSLFPTAKVVGGTDFAGDAYTGSNSPAPDPNPMDCNGHGSHVAGIASGLGVNSDGTTYTGTYGPSTPFNSLKIGPGAAPGAKLYAIRVFGCSGSTSLTVQGIDWAIDPNGDGDFSDHLDVINMSLGSSFGMPANTSLIASQNAALAGVVVVAAAGNDGDTYFIASAPSNAGRAISVAASIDSRLPGGVLEINSPPAIAGNIAAAAAAFGGAAPNPSGQTGTIVLSQDGATNPATQGSPTAGCLPFTNAAAVAGNIALIDRGVCSFQLKVANAQAAGAIGAIVDGNSPGDPTLVTMGPDGVSPAITIPSVFISENDGSNIKAQSGVNGTLGASTSADTLASFSSRGSAEGSPSILKPDIAAPGVNITSTQTGITCITGGGCITPTATGFDPGGQTLTISGTSMATPHVAGIMALLKQLHPDWDVEELKASAMNGAQHDMTVGDGGSGFTYGPGRVGAGRVDPSISAQSAVTAFNGDDAGVVSISFDTPVVGTTTATKNVRLVNHGSSSVTYNLGVDNLVSAPGVSFTFPLGGSITVPAASSVEFPVQMSATGNLMNHTSDPTIAPTLAAPAPLTSLGSLPRQFLTEAGGYVTFSSGSNLKLRLPVYMGTRPASAMFGASSIVTGGAPTGSTTIPLSGTQVCTGTLVAGPGCTGTFPTTEVSLVTPFELQAIHPRNTSVPAYADIQYAGVAYNSSAGLLLFGISTWGDWSTPRDVAFNILIDPTNTGNFTRVLFNSDPGTMAENLFGTAGADAQDTFITATFNTVTSGVGTQQFLNTLSAASVDTAVFKNRVIILAATPASLGITGTSFHWKVQTTSGGFPISAIAGAFETVGPTAGFFWNRAAQGLNFNNSSLVEDLAGGSIPVTWNTANITTNGSFGALFLHLHNADGTQAQVIPLDTAPSADLAITQTASSSPTLNQNVTLTLTVTNNSGIAATNVAVTDLLPSGLTYVSDDSGGAYNSTTGTWAVGSVSGSGSNTLHIVATVETTDPITNLAQITANTPLDPNPANNQASVTIHAPREADLAIVVSPDGGNATAKSDITYQLVVTNNGGDPAYNVQVASTFPLPIKSFTATAGVFNSGTGAWNIASLGKGFSETLTATITPQACGSSETVMAQVSSGIADPNTGNNNSSTTVTSAGLAPVITKNPTNQSLAGSGTITFTAAASGTPTPTVQWQVSTNGGATYTNVPGATSTTLTLTSSPTLDGNLYRAVFTNTCGTATTSPAGTATFNLCIQDNSTKNILQINSTTGDYNFIRCSDGFTLSGKGTVTTANSTVSLTDKKSDRQITASFNLGQLTGSAVVTLTPAPGISQTYKISDTESRGKGCSCVVP